MPGMFWCKNMWGVPAMVRRCGVASVVMCAFGPIYSNVFVMSLFCSHVETLKGILQIAISYFGQISQPVCVLSHLPTPPSPPTLLSCLFHTAETHRGCYFWMYERCCVAHEREPGPPCGNHSCMSFLLLLLLLFCFVCFVMGRRPFVQPHSCVKKDAIVKLAFLFVFTPHHLLCLTSFSLNPIQHVLPTCISEWCSICSCTVQPIGLCIWSASWFSTFCPQWNLRKL